MTFFAQHWPYLDPAEEFAKFAHYPYSLLFDSNCPNSPQNRYSYICWAPIEVIESRYGLVQVTSKDQIFSFTQDPFDVLAERLELYGMDKAHDADLPPFQGGAAGLFGYDLGRGLEVLPETAKDDLNCPDMMIGIYDKVIAFDHHTQQAWLIIHAEDESVVERHKIILARWEDQTPPILHQTSSSTPVSWYSDVNEDQYKNDIQTVIDNIYAGEVFQVNLSRRLQATLPEDFHKYAHYCHMRDINPAPFSAFMNFGKFQIASCSPEQFLHLEGADITTRPIKGTMTADKAPILLEASEKDRAENLMIVDLMRNDLSKISDYFSVKVPNLFRIETYEGVHHMVSDVTARLRPGLHAIDALKACFPGGSITGAPKIRAMEIIEELEPYRRGPYCGSLGMIGFNSYMNTSITIRTLVYQNDMVYFQTGSGIVSDSNPQGELQESLDKAAKILESFEQREWKKQA